MAAALLALTLFLCPESWGAETSPPYTDTNSVAAARNLEKLCEREPAKLSESELGEWVRARFAWIALLRLEGKSDKALEVFGGCGAYCGKHGPSAEWKALKAWGCGKAGKLAPCSGK